MSLLRNILTALGILDEPQPRYIPLPNDVKQAIRDTKEMRADRDAPNLFVGKIINDGSIRCEVVSCTEDDFRIKILEIHWDRLGIYMDLGQNYPLRFCFNCERMMVWEADPETMKRNTSQVILAWEKGIGWIWDLDF
jgi:pyruvate dehydrogenase complex dehydrogenase (E1) component